MYNVLITMSVLLDCVWVSQNITSGYARAAAHTTALDSLTRTFADTINDCISWLALVACSACDAREAVTLASHWVTFLSVWALWIAITCTTRSSNNNWVAVVTRCTPVYNSQVQLYASYIINKQLHSKRQPHKQVWQSWDGGDNKATMAVTK